MNEPRRRFSWGPFFLVVSRKGDWYFRLFGQGLSVQPLFGHRPYFSERYGFVRAWHVRGRCIRPLGLLSRTRKGRASSRASAKVKRKVGSSW